MRTTAIVVGLLSSFLLLGCGDESGAAGSASASAAPAPTPKPTPKPTVSAAPSAEPDAPPRADCPKDSKGGGTQRQPCEASGDKRFMEVKYLRIEDKGPAFNVRNTSDATVNYGEVQIYFYDKAGKQIATKDNKKKLTCAGAKLFDGPMKKGDFFKINFTCLPKDGVPDGVDTIEAEIDMVDIADKADDKKVDLYWRNKDLAPDERPKGGV
jgi:hypothetical protein